MEVVVISPNIQQSAVPIGSMEKVYVPSLAIKISQMLVNTSYMDPMAYKSRPKMSRPVPPPPFARLSSVLLIERKSAPRMAFNWAGESLQVYPDEKVLFFFV